MIRIKYLNYILLSLLIVSCSFEKNKNDDFLPRIQGKPGNLVVTMDKTLYNSHIKDSIIKYMNAEIPHLLRPEDQFTIIETPFDGMSSIMKSRGNIIEFYLDPIINEAGYSIQKNIWARGQRVVQVEAPTEEVMLAYVKEKASAWRKYFNQVETQRLTYKYQDRSNPEAVNKLKEQGYYLAIPHDSRLEPTQDFVYVTRFRERKLVTKFEGENSYENTPHSILQGFLLYELPYENDSIFQLRNMVEVRDSIIKQLPFKDDNAYMYTLYSHNNDTIAYFNPSTEFVPKLGSYAMKMKGIWQSKNAYMGGNFETIFVLSPKKDKVVVVDSYMYAPKFGKREYLRELDAVLTSLEFLNEK